MVEEDTIWWSLLERGYRRMDGARTAIVVTMAPADPGPLFLVRFYYPGERLRDIYGSYRDIQAGIARLPRRAA